jgi:hypothetical protein
MTMLVNATIAAAGTFTSPPWALPSQRTAPPLNLCAQKLFTYGAGGTSLDTFLQTSLDGGTTWADVVHWAQNTTSSDSRPFVANIQPAGAAQTAPVATTDGALTVNTISANLFGLWWRVKYVVVGTYTGGANLLRVDVDSAGLTTAGPGS